MSSSIIEQGRRALIVGRGLTVMHSFSFPHVVITSRPVEISNGVRRRSSIDSRLLLIPATTMRALTITLHVKCLHACYSRLWLRHRSILANFSSRRHAKEASFILGILRCVTAINVCHCVVDFLLDLAHSANSIVQIAALLRETLDRLTLLSWRKTTATF